jgi:hypothetical protein
MRRFLARGFKEVTVKKAILGLATAMLFSAAVAFAAEQTWTGKISDSKCGHSHKDMRGTLGKETSKAECVAACVKAGAQYVFVSKGKTYKISNQTFAGFPENAGHGVKLTGEMTGDTIKVSKIERHEKDR